MAKYVKLGNMWKGQFSPFVTLGDSKSKSEQYNYEVQIMVKNSKGEKVALLKNPLIGLYDPRKNEKRDASKIPDKLMYELSVKLEDENQE